MINKERLTKILRLFPVIRLAYLIGSVAKKNQRQDSDLDIVLVVESQDLNKIDYGKLYSSLSKTIQHQNLDLRLVSLEQNDPLFLFQVIGGKLLYSKEEKERVAFEKKSMLNYFDTQHLRNIFHYYLDKRISRGTYGR